MKLGLISCSKSKQNYPCRAEEMYQPSALFSKAYDFAIEQYDKVAIISAKHGLLLPHEVIEPYEQTLKTMRRKEKKQWAERVYKQLKDKLDFKEISEIFFHAGLEYRENLIPLIRSDGIRVQVPLKGLRQGEQLQWYNVRLQDYD
ncbi:MAG: hypothetical protein NWE88_01875 [Candidatus Bathyarchaeota archaeon]|nr:hypothetical protein [Candidatus Bathyarchaeota archaeon]